MSELSAAITKALANEYRTRASDLHKWVDPLTEEQFWTNPYDYGNSVGHLVLHLTGNLNYYIGARIAGTGYIRNRELEFKETRRPSKRDMLRNIDGAIAMVLTTIEAQSERDWTTAYSAEGEPEARDRFTALLKCAAHFYHHVGQIIYLSRELRKG
jgi:uncharacterized damage-inducible protein DinB